MHLKLVDVAEIFSVEVNIPKDFDAKSYDKVIFYIWKQFDASQTNIFRNVC